MYNTSYCTLAVSYPAKVFQKSIYAEPTYTKVTNYRTSYRYHRTSGKESQRTFRMRVSYGNFASSSSSPFLPLRILSTPSPSSPSAPPRVKDRWMTHTHTRLSMYEYIFFLLFFTCGGPTQPKLLPSLSALEFQRHFFHSSPQVLHTASHYPLAASVLPAKYW